MRTAPYARAIALALATIAGLTGLMLVAGWWQLPWLGLTLLPSAAGAICYLRHQNR